MVDALAQLIQRVELFAGAEVGVELHHRVGAVKVAGKARDEGLAEAEIFFYGDYIRDGYENKYGFSYTCARNPSFGL